MKRECNAEVLREEAHAALRCHDEASAEHIFSRLLEMQPGNVEALQFLAARHLIRNRFERAIELLGVASDAHPENALVWHHLGAAQMQGGNFSAAADSLRHGLKLAPEMFVARLRLGVTLERLGRPYDALVAYFSAINAAQSQQQWLSDATTPSDMREAVKHAMRYVDARRRSLFDAVLEPMRQRYGSPALERVEQCLAIYLDELPADFPDPRQRPKFLYFPGVPSCTFYAQDRFPLHRQLETAADSLRDELRGVLNEAQNTLEPFLGELDDPHLLHASGAHDAAWDAYFFYRHGQRYDLHYKRCPHTSTLLDQGSLVRIRDHAPEILFSVLRPGTHIMPHRGVTNTRLVTHLPLIVPPGCALRVGGEAHAWKEGECVTFDDTFEHEAWNHSDRTRVVLIMDTWNPDLSMMERRAISDLVAAIGDFHHDCHEPVDV